MKIIFFLVGFIATTLGSMTGLGGGVIIKPVLDAISQYNVKDISMLSSITVFSMSIISIIKQTKSGFKIEKKYYYIALGAVIGGLIGKGILNIITSNIDNNLVKAVQSIILAIVLSFVLFKNKFNIRKVENNLTMIILGTSLGACATFLGIGGGPINVAALSIFIGLDIKNSAVISILVIFLSQLANLCLTSINTGFSQYDLTMLIYMIPAAIIGGLVGSSLNRKLKLKQLDYVFNCMMIFIIILNIYNAYVALYLC